MKVLQFAWGSDGADPFLPQNYDKNCVVYTGTHDNDTTQGWYRTTSEKERDYLRRYLRVDGNDVTWDMMRLAMMSCANRAIVPLQDCMNLGSEARMNTPATSSGNWTWRFRSDQLGDSIKAGLAEMAELYGRAYVASGNRPASPHAV
jgi:4-alpha-glucanotransferase